MDLFDIAVARKLSGGGGGGGGDFDTATVTFSCSDGLYYAYGHAVTTNAPVTLVFPLFTDANGQKIFTIGFSSIADINPQVMPTVTGGVQLDEDITVSGDGTFTAAGVPIS